VRRFLVDPADHFAAIRIARSMRLEVVGAYHSHPSGPPVPSATDLAEAHSGGEFLHVILSLLNDELRVYTIADDAFEPQPVTVFS
jgi:proteasome lid subunit RPN8/RPN11